MRNFLKLLLAVTLIGSAPIPAYSNAVIFNGTEVKALKQNLSLNGAVKILSGTTTPTSSAVDAPAGSLYLNTSTGKVYRKTDAGSSTNWIEIQSNLTSSPDLINLGLSVSVSSNIITIAVKSKAGTDPSSSDEVKVGFRDPTATTGTYNQRSITSALSMTLGTTASLGVKTATAGTVYVYLFDNAGTLTLGASLLALDEGSVQSSSTTATSNAVIYQASALASKPIRLIGRFSATWTSGVGWSSITEVSVAPFDKSPVAANYTGTPTGTLNTSYNTVTFPTLVTDTHNAYSSGSYTVPQTGYYDISASIDVTATYSAGNYVHCAFAVDGVNKQIGSFPALASASDLIANINVIGYYLTAGQVVTIKSKTTGSSPSFAATSFNWFNITKR